MFVVENHVDVGRTEPILLVGLFERPEPFPAWMGELEGAFFQQLKELLKQGDISAKYKKIAVIHTLGMMGVRRLLFVGLGRKKELTGEKLAEAFGKASRQAKELRVDALSVDLDSFVTDTLPQQKVAKIFSEALVLSQYRFDGYKQKENRPEVSLERVTVFSGENREDIERALWVGSVFGQATNSARTLVNTPNNLLSAADLADYAAELAARFGFEREILDKEQMEQLGMGALLAVNQGSEQPPKLIVLKYRGKDGWDDVIGLVGKGITFDTGGYSLKTRDGMIGMKTDMAGAAAVLGAMEIIGRLKPAQNVIAVIPATDNMISGKALKPDDVITSLSGKTIEVRNTDAEGRLILADAVTYAKQHGASYLVDVATLTGGVIVALGADKTGAMTNNDGLLAQVMEASKETGEMIWQLPITEKDREKVRNSKIADLNNSPSREGHAIMGGAFIGEFAGDTPWVHLDIAGTATIDKENDLGPAGATGVMVRTLATFVTRFQPLR